MAALVGVVLLVVGWRVFGGADWWPNAVAEVFGILVGGVALAVVLYWLLRQHEDLAQSERSKRLVPVLRGRLHPILDALHSGISNLAGIEVAADTWNPPRSRFEHLRKKLASAEVVSDAEAVERIHKHYDDVRRAVKRAVDECLALGMAYDPSAAFAAQLAALEEAGSYRLRPTYMYSGRGGFDPEDFRSIVLAITDAAMPLAEFVGDPLAEKAGGAESGEGGTDRPVA